MSMRIFGRIKTQGASSIDKALQSSVVVLSGFMITCQIQGPYGSVN